MKSDISVPNPNLHCILARRGWLVGMWVYIEQPEGRRRRRHTGTHSLTQGCRRRRRRRIRRRRHCRRRRSFSLYRKSGFGRSRARRTVDGRGRTGGRGASANQTRPMSDVAAAAGRFSLYHQQVLLHAATAAETLAQRVWTPAITA